MTQSGDLALEVANGKTLQLVGPVVATDTLVIADGNGQKDVGAVLTKYESDIEALWTALNVSHVPSIPQNKTKNRRTNFTWSHVSSVTPAHPLFSI